MYRNWRNSNEKGKNERQQGNDEQGICEAIGRNLAYGPEEEEGSFEESFKKDHPKLNRQKKRGRKKPKIAQPTLLTAVSLVHGYHPVKHKAGKKGGVIDQRFNRPSGQIY